MFLITEDMGFDNTKVLIEEKGGKKNYFIEGVYLQSEMANRNGRIYPKKTLMREVARYQKEYIARNRALGELGHPDGPQLNMHRASHIIQSLKEDGNNWIGKAKILNTPYGKIVKNFMDENIEFGVSSRGMGSLKKKGKINEVQSDFYLAVAADIVHDPSGPDCWVNGMMEGKEWIMDNGIITEIDMEQYRREINRASRSVSTNTEKAILEAFDSFMNKF